MSKYFCLISCFVTAIMYSQSIYTLHINNTNCQPVFKKVTYKKQFPNTMLLYKEINKVYSSLIYEGYLLTSTDSIKHDSLNYEAFLFIGSKFKWGTLFFDKKDEVVLRKLGYNNVFNSGKTFRYKAVAEMMKKVIVYYENNGYPFVATKFDSIKLSEQGISAKLKIDKNSRVILDSLIMEGDAKLNQVFLQRYLGIRPSMLYNEEAFSSISKKIKQLSFVSETKPPVMRMTEKSNKLYLFLNKKSASQFDGIVGILPNDKGGTVFTGDVKLKLVNGIFKNGETIDINWRRLQTQTQDLKAKIIYPYILGTPVGIDYAIKIYKKDSSFIDVTNMLGLNYYFNGLNNLKVFYKQRNANLISTNGLLNATVLPEYADITTKSYGVGCFIEKMDYRLNPKRGVSINIQASVGNRQIRKNPKIGDLAYSSIPILSTQYQSEIEFSGYVPLVKSHIIKLGAQAGSVFGSTIYKNELYRIGGLKTLRGFDEESIYASTYVIPTIEYRFIFEKNSNIFLFGEGAWYENNSTLLYLNDTPVSIGAGINFETKAGIFNLTYALGKQQGNSFDLRIGKIHAGLTALF